MINDDELRRIEADWAGHPADHPGRSDVDYLIAEVRELRLILRDAVQDSTPGNRLWREGVKAGLEEAIARFSAMQHTPISPTLAAMLIRAIDPSTILPSP